LGEFALAAMFCLTKVQFAVAGFVVTAIFCYTGAFAITDFVVAAILFDKGAET